jgi:hypothetical protein
MIQIEVRCKECGRLLDEAPGLAAEQRQPCLSCGSLGRERAVLMIPGEASPGSGSAAAAWLELGGALAKAVSALDRLLVDEPAGERRVRPEKAREEPQAELADYREANRKLREL